MHAGAEVYAAKRGMGCGCTVAMAIYIARLARLDREVKRRRDCLTTWLVILVIEQ